VVNGSSFLLVCESLEVFVASSESVDSPSSRVEVLVVSFETTVEDLASFTPFLLFDIIHVGVTEEEGADKEKCEVAISLIVSRVGLVPVGESAGVLVGKTGSIAHLEVARSSKSTQCLIEKEKLTRSRSWACC